MKKIKWQMDYQLLIEHLNCPWLQPGAFFLTEPDLPEEKPKKLTPISLPSALADGFKAFQLRL
jgi:hypothetical protein